MQAHQDQSHDEPFTLVGTSFGPAGSSLPAYSICPGNTTPSLSWYHAPQGVQRFVLTMHAPVYTQEQIDAGAEQRPFRYWWILYNIPATVSLVPAGGTAGGILGTNIARGEVALGYLPPCPADGGTDIPIAFTLFALSEELEFAAPIDVTWDALHRAMQGKLVESVTLNATFDRILDTQKK